MRKEYFNKQNLPQDVYMVNCGYEDCCDHFYRIPHIREYYLLHYVVKGSGFYEVNGVRHIVSTGEVFLIRPGELVSYGSPDIKDTWSFCWIGFSGNNSDFYALESNLVENKYVYAVHSSGFPSVISNCLEYLENVEGEPSQLRLNSFLLQALSVLERKCKHGASKTTAMDLVERATRYIEYNYMNRISTSGIAEFLSIDRSYFYRIFKKVTNIAPEQYIMNYRMEKAADFLKNSNYSVTEIAGFVGVSDVYYFSKLFKKTIGMPPTTYRKNAAEQGGE